MNSVEIYIKVQDEFKRIDLFKDETITLNSSIQNINDLSKVFTDFSQSFTIPASKNNQIIFNYWNDNAVNDGFDHRIRYDAFIELNTIPFRLGKIQIEKANEKKNRLESFTITFYGNTKQIKDLFKEDELSTLDYSSLNHTYNYANVVGRVDGSILDDVRYPIIGANKRYEYLTGTANDVTIGGSLTQSIVYSNLFPAISVSKIFELIQAKYNLNFTGVFLYSTYFTELYLYCKNSENLKNVTPPALINWTSVSATFPELNLATDKYYLKWTFANNTTPAFFQETKVQIIPTNSAIQYKLVVRIFNSPGYNDGDVLMTFDGLIGTTDNVIFSANNVFATFNAYYTFEVESATPMTFNAVMTNQKVVFVSEHRTGYSATMSTSNTINIQTYVPKIKIIDFFTGIIKMFNLTIIPTNENTFELLPLDFFYGFGNYIDINKYVITDNIDIERPKLFRKLSFKHEKSDNILNDAFRNLFNRDYGDLDYQDLMSNESSSYEIKTPFEDIMWEKTTGYDFVTATLIDKNQAAYKPKPILMYMNDNAGLSTPIKFYDGGGYNNISTYRKFSNELNVGGNIVSLNWGSEQSVNNVNVIADNSLYYLWYRSYIEQLYNLRTRVVKLKTKLPQTMLVDIKMNDKIIFKDKKYTINNFTTNLTNGEVDFELLTDFRPVWGAVGSKFASQELFNISADAQDLQVTIYKGNSEGFDVYYNGAPVYGSLVIGDINTNISVSANVTGNLVLNNISIDYYNNSVITSTRQINIIQQP